MTDEQLIEELYEVKKPLERKLSYSRLSDFDRNGPKALIKAFKEENYGMTIGSIVDDLTIPEKGFKFDDNYIICDYSKPTATLGKLVDIVLENYQEVPSLEKVTEIIKKNGFWSSIVKESTLLSKFNIDEFWKYLEAHIQRNTKNIISQEDYDKALELSNILKSHKFSKDIINTKLDSINQLKIEFEYNGVIFRGMIDKTIINHKEKTVRYIDLKTGKGDALSFMDSFIKFRYYLQEKVYTESFESVCEKLGLKGYKLLPFQFLYIGRSEKIPLLYTISDKWHNAATNGFNIKQYRYKGVNEIIKDVKWHYKHQMFDMPKSIHVNKGSIVLNDDFINLNN